MTDAPDDTDRLDPGGIAPPDAVVEGSEVRWKSLRFQQHPTQPMPPVRPPSWFQRAMARVPPRLGRALVVLAGAAVAILALVGLVASLLFLFAPGEIAQRLAPHEAVDPDRAGLAVELEQSWKAVEAFPERRRATDQDLSDQAPFTGLRGRVGPEDVESTNYLPPVPAVLAEWARRLRQQQAAGEPVRDPAGPGAPSPP